MICRASRRRLNQPVKHPQNPLIRRDKPSEGSRRPIGTVVLSIRRTRGLFKMWYQIWHDDQGRRPGPFGYVTSPDGSLGEADHRINRPTTTTSMFEPPEPFIGGPGVMIDAADKNPRRRFKMMYLAKPEAKPSSLQTADRLLSRWHALEAGTREPRYSRSATRRFLRTGITRLRRFVAYLRFGPPNVRNVSRIESEDFLPLVTQGDRRQRKAKFDAPFGTEFYTMTGAPYAGVYIGVLNTYHGETIMPIPDDQPWMDRVNNQLVFSRNGVTWQRVAQNGAISPSRIEG